MAKIKTGCVSFGCFTNKMIDLVLVQLSMAAYAGNTGEMPRSFTLLFSALISQLFGGLTCSYVRAWSLTIITKTGL